ncbi:MAG TPA: capsule assembly Wzi family protein [Clostridia bacterium]|nr:capsule assembly Wzi family protein [Clostridia bacterium]
MTVLLLLSPVSILAQEEVAQTADPVHQKPQSDSSQATPTPKPKRVFVVSYLKRFGEDQQAIWTSPLRLKARDTKWLLPIGLATGGLIASDESTMRRFSPTENTSRRARQFSDVGAFSAVALSGLFYGWGHFTDSDHLRETGILTGEAVTNAAAVTTALKLVTRRPRPLEDNRAGRFWSGGASFPSDHASVSWAAASVIAHEYPGTGTKLLAYGGAAAISTARVIGQQHFPSDVLIGSTIGWLVGRQIYRAHHDTSLGGEGIGTFVKETGETKRSSANMASPSVPMDSWIYPVFDRLIARGYIQSAFLGLRPWTRMECARLLQEASAESELGPDDADLEKLVKALSNEFALESRRLDGDTNLGAEIDSIYTRVGGIQGRPLTDGLHFGQTVINDDGRPYGEGFNSTLGVSGRAVAGPAAISFRGEYQHSAPNIPYSLQLQQTISDVDVKPIVPGPSANSLDRLHIVEASVAVQYRDISFSFGKQPLWWGPGRGQAMLFSNNAESIYMFRMTRTAPILLPWIFSKMGPIRSEMFLGKLSGHVGPARPMIHGEKISFKPTPNLELGFSRTVIFAGAGTPLTPRLFFKTYFSVGDHPNADLPGNDAGDRRGGFDFSYRVPGLRKWLVLYNDSMTDDDPSALAAPHRAAMNPGIYIPQLPGLPKVDFRAEAVYTDIPGTPTQVRGGHFAYWNGVYRDSYTNNRQLIATWAGRDSRGLQLWSTYWISPFNRIQFGYRHQIANPEYLKGGNLHNFSAKAEFRVKSNYEVSAFTQYERWNFPMLSSGTNSNFATWLQISYRPGHSPKPGTTSAP